MATSSLLSVVVKESGEHLIVYGIEHRMPEIVVSSLDSSVVDSSLTLSFGRTKSTEPSTRDVLVSPSVY